MLPPEIDAVLRHANPTCPVDHVTWSGRTSRRGPVVDHAGRALDVRVLIWLVATNGRPIPSGWAVVAACGHPACVRPGHLRLVHVRRWMSAGLQPEQENLSPPT